MAEILGKVYFIRAGPPNGRAFVKIGFTSGFVSSRLSDLQVGNPYKLEILYDLPGGPQLEREMHKKFAKLRYRGEWFRFKGKLKAWLTRENADLLTWPNPEELQARPQKLPRIYGLKPEAVSLLRTINEESQP